MMKHAITLICFLLFIDVSSAQKMNRLNKRGNRIGRWVTYIDDEKKIKSFEGKFKNGRPVGKSYFYNSNGTLDRREINRFTKLKTTFYYEDGKIRLKGNARLDNLADKIHYYFYGKWTHYNEHGELIKYTYYKNGELSKTVYKDKNNRTNDSLIDALLVMDRTFNASNTRLTDSINANRNNSFKYNTFKKQLQLEDSMIFLKIQSIIDVYGFPSAELAGDASGIPFYIIGFAPLNIKEKYLPQLKTAADKGNVSWKSLAFFIDKIKVAKKEKQIYGTQGNYDKGKFNMYPCEDPENLNKRRVGVGLEEE